VPSPVGVRWRNLDFASRMGRCGRSRCRYSRNWASGRSKGKFRSNPAEGDVVRDKWSQDSGPIDGRASPVRGSRSRNLHAREKDMGGTSSGPLRGQVATRSMARSMPVDGIRHSCLYSVYPVSGNICTPSWRSPDPNAAVAAATKGSWW